MGTDIGIECRELARFLQEEAHLFFDDGYIFGEQGAGFERWNIACPTKYILAALDRLKVALRSYLVKEQKGYNLRKGDAVRVR